MSAQTAKNWLFERAPKFLQLFGDKLKKVESAQHIIEFPGGAVEVTRLDDGSYWCHLIVNQGWASAEIEGRQSARGEVVDSRIDTADGIVDIPGAATLQQIAVLIKPILP